MDAGELKHPVLAKTLSTFSRPCFLVSTTIIFLVIVLVSAPTMMICLGFYESAMKDNSIIYISSEEAYQPENGTVILSCIFPALKFPAEPTDQSCVDQSGFYCPAKYECSYLNGNLSAPICYSETNPCENDTICYNVLNEIPFAPDGISKYLELSYSLGWVIYSYFVLGIIMLIFIPSPCLYYFFYKKDVLGISQFSTAAREQIKDKNVKYLKSYNSILEDSLTEESSWERKDIIKCTIVTIAGIILILGFVFGMSVVIATTSPSLTTLDEIQIGNCFDTSIFSKVRAPLLALTVFGIAGSLSVLFLMMLITSSLVERVYLSIWHTRACCYFTGIFGFILIAFGVLAMVVALT